MFSFLPRPIPQPAARRDASPGSRGSGTRGDVRVPLERFWTFPSCTCASAPETLQQQCKALEAAGMAEHPRQGQPFDDYFTRSDLTLHACVCEGELLGFAILDRDHLHELHAAYLRCGIGSSLLRAVEAAGKRPSLSLHVHRSNLRARAFYKSMGFDLSRACDKDMLLMSKDYLIPAGKECRLACYPHSASFQLRYLPPSHTQVLSTRGPRRALQSQR